jgi:hypothetical protein
MSSAPTVRKRHGLCGSQGGAGARGGWRFFLISEDTEFAWTAYCTASGSAIATTRLFYDEQTVAVSPSGGKDALDARVFSVFGKWRADAWAYPRSFACYDVGVCSIFGLIISLIGMGPGHRRSFGAFFDMGSPHY